MEMSVEILQKTTSVDFHHENLLYSIMRMKDQWDLDSFLLKVMIIIPPFEPSKISCA